MTYRAGILKIDGTREAENFDTKEKAEQWILNKAEKNKIKKSMIVNKENIKEREITSWE